MSLKHLLVHVDSTPRSDERLGLALTLARRFGARVTGLFAESDSLGSSIVGRRSVEHLRAAARRAQDHFTARTAEAGADAEWWSLGREGHGELVGLTAACCRYADLALFGQHDPAQGRLPSDLLERVLEDCGRPLLVVPAGGHHPDVGRRVVVGWNASRGSARAVNDALPLMKDAEFVGVVAFQEEAEGEADNPMPPVSIVAHLALHGIRPSYERAVQGDEKMGVAGALLNYAFEARADLTVTGVHHAATFRHGGFTTRELLASMTAPVLLAQ